MLKRIKEIYEKMNKNTKVFTIAAIAVVILSVLLMIINRNVDYTEVRLKSNKKPVFEIGDLTANDLVFGNTEQMVKRELGKPKKEKKETKGSYEYKKLYYDGITLLLRENYDDYMLVGVEITSHKYKIARNIKVNDSITKTMKKFKVTNEQGAYIYGNYSVNALKENEITDNIFIGTRSKEEVVYYNRDAVVDEGMTNISVLSLKYKKGKIKKIIWSYDFQ